MKGILVCAASISLAVSCANKQTEKLPDSQQVNRTSGINSEKMEQLGKMMKEAIAMALQFQQNPNLQNDQIMLEKAETIGKQINDLIVELGGTDQVKSNAIADEAVRTYDAEHYQDYLKMKGAQQLEVTNAQLAMIGKALERYYAERGELPTNEQGLTVLCSTSVSRKTPYLDGGEKYLKDVWGNPIVYDRLTLNTFSLKSPGPDGKEGTGDDIEFKSGR